MISVCGSNRLTSFGSWSSLRRPASWSAPPTGAFDRPWFPAVLPVGTHHCGGGAAEPRPLATLRANRFWPNGLPQERVRVVSFMATFRDRLCMNAQDIVVETCDLALLRRASHTQQRFFIRHVRHANPAETPVHHVGVYSPFHNLVAPIALVLQDQHAQRYFRWRLPPPVRAAPPMSFPLAPGRPYPTTRILQQLILHFAWHCHFDRAFVCSEYMRISTAGGGRRRIFFNSCLDGFIRLRPIGFS